VLDDQTSTERERIEAALAQTKGRVSGSSGAAAKLGVPASTLESKVRALKINKYSFKGSLPNQPMLPDSEPGTCQNSVKLETRQIRMFDLNLLRVFDAIMLYRSVRKASQALSVTPSAVSHALSRLRQSIGDELFIPSEFGMRPTPRALELASPVREGLKKFEVALRGKQSASVETHVSSASKRPIMGLTIRNKNPDC
jgi:hypothetical protein